MVFLTGIAIFVGITMLGAAVSEFIEMKRSLQDARFELIEVRARLNAYVEESARIQRQTLRLVTDIGLKVGSIKFDRKEQEKFDKMLDEALAWNPAEPASFNHPGARKG
ncbi:hypothetical protein ACQKIE_00210 [Luteibacter sp. NPDC031894]|uniref:hypothetical protein n=1 Tax=Luteibacter sp. NPDC031894 TaxID=3390572 RepID=UPI003CFDBBAC